ncbi:MAG: hypothetical protein HYX22_00390 [Candidatus Yanofskybacteria bacterium]|nr:hypothetical protein [Candidatus Yanofskybacteria bacterium]
MNQRQSLLKFRDWLFDLLIDYFTNSDWIIVIKDFKNSENKKERILLGQTNYAGEVIYLDKNKRRGTPRILIHEICHFALVAVLEGASGKLAWKDLEKVRGRRRADKELEWRELRTKDFERLFYRSLTKRQIKILQGFIDEAHHRNTEEAENMENTE